MDFILIILKTAIGAAVIGGLFYAASKGFEAWSAREQQDERDDTQKHLRQILREQELGNSPDSQISETERRREAMRNAQDAIKKRH